MIGAPERKDGEVDHFEEGTVVTDVTGEVHRLEAELAARPPLVRVVGSDQCSKKPGTVGGRVGPRAGERGLDDQRVILVPYVLAQMPYGQAECGLNKDLVVTELLCKRGCLAKRGVGIGMRCESLGAERDQELSTLVFVGRGLAGEQVEGLLIPADRVVGRERVAGRVAGAADVAEGLVEVGGPGGGDPVVRQLGQRAPRRRCRCSASSVSAMRWWARARRVGD